MKKLLEYLEKKNIKTEVLEHKLVYTALDLANTLKADLSEVAKNLLVRVDKNYYVVILPASHNLKMEKLKAIFKKTGQPAKVVEITKESVMKKILKLKKSTQGMLSFGSFYKLPVIIDKTFTKKKQVIFNGGDFERSLRLRIKDFINIEKPLIGSIGVRRKIIVAKVKKFQKVVKKAVQKTMMRSKKNGLKRKNK